MRTYGKPQIKATSTCPSANSSKDCPTSRVVWRPTLSPTYLAMCAYVEYIMGERNVAKRIGVVLSLMRHPLVVPRTAPLVILSAAKDLSAALLLPILNFSNQQETLYVSPLHVLPAQDATPSQVSIYLPELFFPRLLPLHARSGALRHSKYQCS